MTRSRSIGSIWKTIKNVFGNRKSFLPKTDSVQTMGTVTNTTENVINVTSITNVTSSWNTTTTTMLPMANSEDGSDLYYTMGGVVGAVVFIILVIVVCYIYRYQKQANRNIMRMNNRRRPVAVSMEILDSDLPVTPVSPAVNHNPMYGASTLEDNIIPGGKYTRTIQEAPSYENTNLRASANEKDSGLPAQNGLKKPSTNGVINNTSNSNKNTKKVSMKPNIHKAATKRISDKPSASEAKRLSKAKRYSKNKTVLDVNKSFPAKSDTFVAVKDEKEVDRSEIISEEINPQYVEPRRNGSDMLSNVPPAPPSCHSSSGSGYVNTQGFGDDDRNSSHAYVNTREWVGDLNLPGPAKVKRSQTTSDLPQPQNLTIRLPVVKANSWDTSDDVYLPMDVATAEEDGGDDLVEYGNVTSPRALPKDLGDMADTVVELGDIFTYENTDECRDQVYVPPSKMNGDSDSESENYENYNYKQPEADEDYSYADPALVQRMSKN